MKRIILSVLMCVVLFCCAVCGIGCDNVAEIPYNAVILGGSNIMNEDFLYKEENMVEGAYENRNYDPNDPESERYIYYSSFPAYRIIRVTEQMLSTEVFKNVPETDLDTKMILIILYSLAGSYEANLKNIELNEDNLKITISVKYFGILTSPRFVCSVIMLDNLNFNNSELCFA